MRTSEIPRAELAFRVQWVDGAVEQRLASNSTVSVGNEGPITAIVTGLLGASGMTSNTAAAIAARWATDALSWLPLAHGDFSLVVHDASTNTVRLCTNVAGTRPLFYRSDSAGISVSSAFEGIEPTLGPPDRLVDEDSVQRMLNAQQLRPGRTLRSDISSVPAAHIVTISPSGTTHERYWAPVSQTSISSTELTAVANDLRDVLAEVIGDVVDQAKGRLGVHVTPGLDSTTLARLVVDGCDAAGRERPQAYAWQPEPSGSPELDQRLILEVLASIDLSCHWQPTDQNFVARALQLDPLQMPTTSTLFNEIATIEQASSDGVSTIVCGWGGDEFVSYNGRHRSVMSSRNRLKRKLADLVRRQGVRRFGLPPSGLSAQKVSRSARRESPVGQTAHSTQRAFLENQYLSERTDAWSAYGAAWGVQHVYPLLDRRVLEFVFSLDEKYFLDHRTLMREVARGLIPDSVRLNTDKTDAARSKRTGEEIAEVLSAVRAAGLGNAIDGNRAHLIDLRRLDRSLAQDEPRNRGKVMRALQFALAEDFEIHEAG